MMTADDYVDFDSLDWVKDIKSKTTGGGNLRLYRERDGLTQTELAKKLDEYRQNISNMEKGSRPISLEMAKKLGSFFETDFRKFL